MENVFINPEQKDWRSILQRPVFDSKGLELTVSDILADVKTNGEEAVKKYAATFDKVLLNQLLVSDSEINEAIT